MEARSSSGLKPRDKQTASTKKRPPAPVSISTTFTTLGSHRPAKPTWPMAGAEPKRQSSSEKSRSWRGGRDKYCLDNTARITKRAAQEAPRLIEAVRRRKRNKSCPGNTARIAEHTAQKNSKNWDGGRGHGEPRNPRGFIQATLGSMTSPPPPRRAKRILPGQYGPHRETYGAKSREVIGTEQGGHGEPRNPRGFVASCQATLGSMKSPPPPT